MSSFLDFGMGKLAQPVDGLFPVEGLGKELPQGHVSCHRVQLPVDGVEQGIEGQIVVPSPENGHQVEVNPNGIAHQEVKQAQSL